MHVWPDSFEKTRWSCSNVTRIHQQWEHQASGWWISHSTLENNSMFSAKQPCMFVQSLDTCGKTSWSCSNVTRIYQQREYRRPQDDGTDGFCSAALTVTLRWSIGMFPSTLVQRLMDPLKNLGCLTWYERWSCSKMKCHQRFLVQDCTVWMHLGRWYAGAMQFRRILPRAICSDTDWELVLHPWLGNLPFILKAVPVYPSCFFVSDAGLNFTVHIYVHNIYVHG